MAAYKIPCLKSDNTTLVRNTTGGSVTGLVFTMDSVADIEVGMFVVGTGITSNVFVQSVGTNSITLSTSVTLNNAALTFCNCSITEASIPKVSGAALGNSPDTVVCTISKFTGTNSNNFSLDASTFKVGGRTYSQNSNSLVYTHGVNGVSFPSGILKVTLANTGTAGSLTNGVTATVDLDDNFTMPNADTTLDFDLEGNCTLGATNTTTAYLTSFEPNSAHVTCTTNTGSNPAVFENSVGTVNYIEENYYTGNAIPGTTGMIFEKTVNAATGKHFNQEPNIQINSDDENRLAFYTVSKSNQVYDSQGNLTSIKLRVDFTWQTTDTQEFHNDVALITDFTVSTTPTISNKVENVSGDFNFFPSTSGAIRSYTIYGSGPAPKFNLTITRTSDNATYDFENGIFNSTATSLSNVSIPSIQQGGYALTVVYPITSSSRVYNWVLTGGTSTSLSSNIPSTNPTYVVNGYGNVTQTFAKSTLSGYSAVFTSLAETTATGMANDDLNPVSKSPVLQITKTGGGNVELLRNAIVSDWSNLTSNGFDVINTSLTTTGANSSTVTVSSGFTVDTFGTANNTSTFNLSNIVKVTSGSSQSPLISAIWQYQNVAGGAGNPTTITNTNHQGSLTTSNFASGNTSFVINISSWDLHEPAAEGGVPDFIDAFGDIGGGGSSTGSLEITFKDSSYNTITGPVSIPLDTETSSITAVEDGVELTLSTNNVTVSVSSEHNSGNGLIAGAQYYLYINAKYYDIAQ